MTPAKPRSTAWARALVVALGRTAKSKALAVGSARAPARTLHSARRFISLLAFGFHFSGPAASQGLEALSVLSPLQFGSIAVLGPGAVTVLPQGVRVAEGLAYLVGVDSSQPAQLLVASRVPHMAFSLSLPQSFSLIADGGASTLTVTHLSRSPGPQSTGASGSTTIGVGATLLFPGVPPPGLYRGSFPVELIWH